MLAKRIIPVLQLKNGQVVKSLQFVPDRRFGDIMQFVKVYHSRGIDELVVLDISNTKNEDNIDFETLRRIAKEVRIPMTYGGGIRNAESAEKVLSLGVEKLLLGSIMYENPDEVRLMQKSFGSSSLVGAIDYRRGAQGERFVYTHAGTSSVGVSVDGAMGMIQNDLELGEAFITSIDSDGTRSGYDLWNLYDDASAIQIPIVINGGAWNYDHLCEALNKPAVWGVASASMYMFSERTTLRAAHHLVDHGIHVRDPAQE